MEERQGFPSKGRLTASRARRAGKHPLWYRNVWKFSGTAMGAGGGAGGGTREARPAVRGDAQHKLDLDSVGRGGRRGSVFVS